VSHEPEPNSIDVPCHRIDTVLDHMGVKIVDYLSLRLCMVLTSGGVQVNVIGVEHSERSRRFMS
jgi:hypothetical protein